VSPAAQFTAVAAIVFAVLGFEIVAFAVLGLTLALLLLGFRTPASPTAGVGDTHDE
jgi:hypothetical protein